MMKKCFLILSGLILMLAQAWPQSSAGTVSGTVRDQSGGVIPNASVVMENIETTVRVTTQTNEAGIYFFPATIAGSYRLSVNVPGMDAYRGEFVVRAAESRVIDPVLKPGQTVTSVVVTDTPSLVAVDNAVVSDTVEHARIEQLPVNGRQINTFQTLLPGAEGTGGTNGFRLFGQPAQAEEWIVDGAVMTDRRWNMSLYSQTPGVGAVQEFTVLADAVTAKYTRPVNVVVSTKSGTDQLHGTAYETIRNSAIGVARRRQDTFTKAPHLVRNEFGFNAGGPVIIPKLYNGRKRTFWFFNYEALRLAQTSTVTYNLPTADMRNGDFSGLKDSQGRLQVLYDPLSTGSAPNYQRTPFIGNVIPTNRESPTAKFLYGITPLPNYNANPLVDFNWYGQSISEDRHSSLVGRLDHRFSDKDIVYARFTLVKAPEFYNSGLPSLNNAAGAKTVIDSDRSGALSWTHTFSPTLFNELLASGRYRIGGGYSGTSTTVATDWFGQLGMPNPFGVRDWPNFPSSGTPPGLGLGNYGLTSPGVDRANETFYILDDNVTKIHGKHEFLFGAHVRDDLMNIHPNDAGQDSFSFNTMATALYSPSASTPTNPAPTPQTGSNLANMYLGAATYQDSLVRQWYYLRGGEAALYFQDNYKMTSRLTVNLGLRWEYWKAYRDKNNILVGFDPSNHSIVLGTDLNTMYKAGASLPSVVSAYQDLGLKFETYQAAGLPQNLEHSRDKNFGPRAGFAYRAFDGKKAFVIRGGYSLSYFNMDQNSFVTNMNNNTPLTATFSYNPLDATQAPNGLPNYGLISAPTYIAGVNSSGAISLDQPRGITRGTAQISYFSPNLPDSRVHSWNLTLEKEVMSSTVARIRYVGNHSADLSQWYSYNQPTPDYIYYASTGQPKPTGAFANVALRPFDQQVLGTIQQYTNSGFANVQSADFELEHRFSHGYAYQVSYVLTNALATPLFGTVPATNQFLPGSVPTNYDQLNSFLNYQRDTSIPKHRIKWNWLIDIPVGKSKRFLGNAGPVLNKFVGGWQLAGIGTLGSTYFSLPTTNWNFTGEPVHLYGYQYPIQNCTSGACVPGYLWWNGYIPANQINSHDAQGRPNGYEGVPANYKPAVTPLIPWGSTALPANAPANTNVSQYWDTNNVWIPLNNGTSQIVGYNSGLNPWRNQYLPSVWQWNQDASIFKNVRFGERIDLRFSADFFNVFNHPGNPSTVGGDGVLNTRTSGNPARVIQLGLRLNW